MSSTLLTHCGAVKVTRDALRGMDTPQGTASWRPVPHAELLDVLHAELRERGMEVVKEAYAVQRGNNLLFGTLDLNWKNNGEYAAAIGLRTSNDKSMSLQLAVGARIFVCDNLCFAGDLIALRRKHTGRLDLHKEIAEGLDRYERGMRSLDEGIGTLKRLTLTEMESTKFIYDIFRKKIVPLKLFHPVTASYTKARDAGNRISAWGLHNAFTEHIKTLRPAPQFKATLGLGKFFNLN